MSVDRPMTWDELAAENTRLREEVTRLHADACKPKNCPHCIPATCDAVQAARREGEAENARLKKQVRPEELAVAYLADWKRRVTETVSRLMIFVIAIKTKLLVMRR